MVYRGIYKDGVIVFDAAPPLKEGQTVRVRPVRQSRKRPRRGTAPAVLQIAGTWAGAPGEVDWLSAQLGESKRAEVAAERARLGLPAEGDETDGPVRVGQ